MTIAVAGLTKAGLTKNRSAIKVISGSQNIPVGWASLRAHSPIALMGTGKALGSSYTGKALCPYYVVRANYKSVMTIPTINLDSGQN